MITLLHAAGVPMRIAFPIGICLDVILVYLFVSN
jgi:hypothetical protein